MNNCYRSWMKSDAVNMIFDALEHNARFVGGAVRDAMLGIDSNDIDIATPIDPEEVIRRLQNKNIKTIPTGLQHGTVTAHIQGMDYEITTLRRDIECFGRQAKVEFTEDWLEDASRRDLTINALSCSQDGEIFDYFDGVKDLKSGKVRFIGNAKQRCQEDYLRILRFFRFYAKYGKAPADNDSILACKEYAHKINDLSAERITSEIFKLLLSPNPIESLKLMKRHNILEHIMPKVTDDKIEALSNLLTLNQYKSDQAILYLSILIKNSFDTIQKIANSWRLSNNDKNLLLFLTAAENHLEANIDQKLTMKKLRIWGKQKFQYICMLEYAFGMDLKIFESLYNFANQPIPIFPIKGRDLIKAGIKPGQKLGTILKEAEDWWEEQYYKPNEQEILDFILTNKIK